MFAVVQPIFESLAVFAWCLLLGVVPASETPQPDREQVANEKAVEVFKGLADGVALRSSKRYLAQLSPELQKKHGAAVEGVLDSPKRHCLVMRYKLEPVAVGSYEATYKAKILTEAVCPTSGYQSNIEYATVTIAPAADSTDGKFFSKAGEGDPAAGRWEITKWDTEKVVPYDKNADR